MHRSGECNCGAFASAAHERATLKALYPDFFRGIEALEAEVEAAGLRWCRWGGYDRDGNRATDVARQAPGLLFEACDSRLAEPAPPTPCFTRARYGTKHCANDRLPAEQLERAVTRRLWKVLDDHDRIEDAISEAYERLSERDDEQQSELAAIQDKLTETRAALDRYFRAFEAGTMPEDTCAPRIASLSEQVKSLENRAAELAARQDDEHLEHATTADLDALRSNLRAALNDSTPARVKGVLQTMIDGIRVDARDQIEPAFRVPAVRIESGYMEPARLNANHYVRLHGGHIALSVGE